MHIHVNSISDIHVIQKPYVIALRQYWSIGTKGQLFTLLTFPLRIRPWCQIMLLRAYNSNDSSTQKRFGTFETKFWTNQIYSKMTDDPCRRENECLPTILTKTFTCAFLFNIFSRDKTREIANMQKYMPKRDLKATRNVWYMNRRWNNTRGDYDPDLFFINN